MSRIIFRFVNAPEFWCESDENSEDVPIAIVSGMDVEINDQEVMLPQDEFHSWGAERRDANFDTVTETTHILLPLMGNDASSSGFLVSLKSLANQNTQTLVVEEKRYPLFFSE